MINLLNSATDLLSVTQSAAGTLDIYATWVDLASNGSGDPTPSRTVTAMTTATTTTIVATPAASTVRNVREIYIRNKHATLATDVTVNFNVNGTLYELYKTTLAAGEGLAYSEEYSWFELTSTVAPALPNYSTTAQTPTAATLTQLAGSSITVPATKLRIGTIFKWKFDITKTGAGTATSAYHVRIGTANSTADTAVLTFTKPLGTGVIDTGIIQIDAVVRGPLSASCIIAGMFELRHNLATTGHNVTPATATPAYSFVVSSAFDATVSGLFVSLSCTTGASDAITTQIVIAESVNL